mmetsp:Transcript_45316/g.78367  ORF Transcript_45316/g.78367 Transcript_45316/m.78367 type:complete len:275 (+) Transcript_45316:939-1763(+)
MPRRSSIAVPPRRNAWKIASSAMSCVRQNSTARCRWPAHCSSATSAHFSRKPICSIWFSAETSSGGVTASTGTGSSGAGAGVPCPPDGVGARSGGGAGAAGSTGIGAGAGTGAGAGAGCCGHVLLLCPGRLQVPHTRAGGGEDAGTGGCSPSGGKGIGSGAGAGAAGITAGIGAGAGAGAEAGTGCCGHVLLLCWGCPQVLHVRFFPTCPAAAAANSPAVCVCAIAISRASARFMLVEGCEHVLLLCPGFLQFPHLLVVLVSSCASTTSWLRGN